MNILFDINHPAHVHLFKNAIKILETKGHQITITARDKDITIQLLDNYNLSYSVLSKAQKGLLGLGIELVWRQMKLLPILLKRKIQVCVSATGACSVHICKVLGIPTLVFYDTEHAKLQNALTIPFATRFITPKNFQGRLGKNHITYDSVHDLAYLHPKYFTPDPAIYESLRIPRNKNFIIMRFVSWEAAHDVGQKGMSLDLRRAIIKLCSPHTSIFIVSESPISEEFEKYRFPIAPDKMHDALSFATMYIGEGGSMATEAAILGTPSIFISSLTAGVFKELENHYALMYSFAPDQKEKILQKIGHLLNDKSLKKQWQRKKEKFIDDKIDLTQRMIEDILNYNNYHN